MPGGADVFVSVSGSDSNACSQARPCASFGRAYQVAAAGDVISVGAGVYGEQEVPDGTKSVTFAGVSGNKVRELHDFAANVTFDGIDVDAGGGTPSDGAAYEVEGVPNVTFKNGRIGNVVDEKGALLGGWNTADNIHTVLDNVEFHDVVQVDPDIHNECVFSEAPGLVIRNSTFRNCATMDLMITRGDWWGQPTYGGVTLENNVFGHSVNGNGWHYFGFLVHGNMGQFTNARVVNNTFENAIGGMDANSFPDGASGVWANNLGGGYACQAGITYRNNIGTKCDTSDKATTPASSVRAARLLAGADDARRLGQPGPERLPPQADLDGHQRRQRDLCAGQGQGRQRAQRRA